MIASALLGWTLAVAGCSGGAATCIAGSTQACLCVGGGMGVQSCLPDGTYGACDCGGVDAGPPPVDGGPLPGVDSGPTPGEDAGPGTDAGAGVDGGPSACPSPLALCGGRCVDTSTDETNCGGCADATHTCAVGSFCIAGTCTPVGSCAPPLVTCGGECIDPRTSPAHCGASGDCTGAAAGAVCGGGCFGGECVFESCSAVLALMPSATSGLYLVDVDGTGPIPPRDAYCDMTTAGGGWMLVYRIRNDVPDIADPWWPMVGLGSGDALPTDPSPLPAGVHFDGPVRAVRSAAGRRIAARSGQSEMRATMITSTGAVRLDVRELYGNAMGYAAIGTPGTPAPVPGCPGSSSITPSAVISAAAGLGLSPGDRFSDCVIAAGGGADWFAVTREGTSTPVPYCGDDSFGVADTTTLFWLREYVP